MPYIGKVTAGGNSEMLVGSTLYGNCTSGAGTVSKSVNIAGFDALLEGVTIHVRFTNTNTAVNPTLNVSSTGAVPIYRYGNTVIGTTVGESWPAKSIVSLTYQKTDNASGCWVMNDHIDVSITGVKGDAETDYRVGNVNIKSSDIGALPITGGTIVGDTTANISNKNMVADVTDSANGVTSTSISSNSVFYDKNSQKVSSCENRFEANGDVSIRLGARNWITESNTFSSYNTFTLGCNKFGSAYYNVSAPQPLRNQLGIAYGTCTTAANTSAKIVEVDSLSYKLTKGAYIAVKFTNTNTASSPSLNVNSTGAKSVVYGTGTIVNDNLKYAGTADIVMYYVYDGTSWVWLGQSQDENATGFLPITGGTITGNVTEKGILTLYREGTTSEDLPSRITFSNKDTTTGNTYSSAHISAYQDHGSTTSQGNNIVIHPGGGLFLGGGEAAGNHYNAWKASIDSPPYSTENIYITSDAVVNIQGNGGTIENRKGVRINTAGNLVPIVADEPTDGVQSLGSPNTKWNAVYATTIYGDLSGNATSATEFSTNKNVTLTGDVTGTASSKGGWSVTTTLSNSGVTAGSYGPSANATPSVDGTFDVPYITVDAKGRLTAASTKTVTLPSDSAKANLASPTFTGTPKAPTASSGTNNTQIATTAFVNTAITDAALPKTTSTPQANVDSTTGVIGTETKYAAGDHQHPAQTYVDSVRHVGAVNVATAIAANRIGVYDPTAGGYVQLAANVEFSLNWPILYFPTAAAVGSYTDARLTYPAAANSGASSMTVGQQTWLRLLLTSEVDRTVIYVSTVKTVADTKTNPYIYIPLGVASTSSAIYFNPAQYGSVLINQPGYIVG